MVKDSLKKFYEYYASDEELMYYIRMNAEWNENSFNKMKQLARDVMRDYADEDYYPKKFVVYFFREIPSVINIISNFRKCTNKELQAGYTDETYLCMIADRINQLKEFRWEFIKSLEKW